MIRGLQVYIATQTYNADEILNSQKTLYIRPSWASVHPECIVENKEFYNGTRLYKNLR